jgi:hypothetical protein
LAFTLEQVVPWGRSFDEYRRMFALSDDDLRTRIVGCADGPASFNAELTAHGGRVVSCDPLYQWTADQIRGRIDATSPQIVEQTRRNGEDFCWDTIRSVDELARVRHAAMKAFLADYPRGTGRYVAGELPKLPFTSDAFDIAVCSHFLFLYTSHLSDAFHVAAVREMCRVAGEVRVFPLITLDGRPSGYLPPVTKQLRELGHRVSIEPVSYEFQRGGNEMMRMFCA